MSHQSLCLGLYHFDTHEIYQISSSTSEIVHTIDITAFNKSLHCIGIGTLLHFKKLKIPRSAWAFDDVLLDNLSVDFLVDESDLDLLSPITEENNYKIIDSFSSRLGPYLLRMSLQKEDSIRKFARFQHSEKKFAS